MAFFIDPGGKIEEGETAEQALVRELKEELSIDVDESDLEFFGQFVAEAANNKGKTVLLTEPEIWDKITSGEIIQKNALAAWAMRTARVRGS